MGETSMGVACRKRSALCPRARATAFTAPLDPEDGVAVVRFHGEAQVAPAVPAPAATKLNTSSGFCGSPSSSGKSRVSDCMTAGIVIAIFFQKLIAILEGEAAFARRKQRKEKLRAFAQAGQAPESDRGDISLLLLQRGSPRRAPDLQPAGCSREFRNSFPQRLRVRAPHRRSPQQHPAGCPRRAPLGLPLDGEVGEEQMVVDDDDVALQPPGGAFR